MLTITARTLRSASVALFLCLAFAFAIVSTPAASQEILVSGTGIAKPGSIDATRLAGFPAVEIATKTPWTGPARFSGPRLTDVLASLGASGSKVTLIAVDDYKVELQLADIQHYQPIIAVSMNGQPLPLRGRGPFWLMFPFDEHPEIQNDTWYFRAIWQIDRIRVDP
jgi:hypothetical protein